MKRRGVPCWGMRSTSLEHEVWGEIKLLMHHDENGTWTLQSNGLPIQFQFYSLMANSVQPLRALIPSAYIFQDGIKLIEIMCHTPVRGI